MKKKTIVILGILFLLMPLHVKAATTPALSCGTTTLKPGASTNCTLSITTQEKISSINAKLVAGSNLEITTVTPASGWWGDANDKNIAYITDNNKTGTFNIATFQVKANASLTAGASTSVTANSISLYNDSFSQTSITTTTISKSIKITSTINTLKSLTVSGTSFSFNPNTTTYNLTSSSSTATISAQATSTSAKVTGTGTKNLAYGKNTYKINVTSESGSTKTYTINITRNDSRSSNNNLASLSVSGGTIKFSSSTTSYSLTVPSTQTSTTIKATLASSKASFTSGYGPRTVNLHEGNNAISIQVKAENGSKKTYTINITRKSDTKTNKDKEKPKDTNANDNTLKALTLSNGAIDFKSDVTSYNVTLPHAIEQVNIYAEATSKKSSVTGTGKKTLKVGSNTFSIVVTPASGQSKTYTLNITREKKTDTELDNDNYLENLTIKDHEIQFDKNKTDYEVTLKSGETILEINAERSSVEANVIIEGNEDLKDGSVIKITVTSASGNNRIYTITTKEEKTTKKDTNTKQSNNADTTFILAASVFAVGALVLVIALINRKIKLSK